MSINGKTSQLSEVQLSLGEVASLSRTINEARVEGTHYRKGQLPLRGV